MIDYSDNLDVVVCFGLFGQQNFAFFKTLGKLLPIVEFFFQLNQRLHSSG